MSAINNIYDAMVAEIRKREAVDAPKPWVWFLSPNALEKLTIAAFHKEHRTTLGSDTAPPPKTFMGYYIHLEDTWSWGWCLFDRSQIPAGFRLPKEWHPENDTLTP